MAKFWYLRPDLRLVLEIALFCSKIGIVYTCTEDSQCPRGQTCLLDGGYCQLQQSFAESSSNVVVLAPVGGVLTLCIGILIFFICYRRYTKKRRRDCADIPNGRYRGNIASVQGRYERTEEPSQRSSGPNVQVCSSSTPNHLNLGFEVLNPPPYFSIFTLITQEGNDVQRTVMATSEVQEVQVVWERDEDFPPAYDTLSLGPPWPPAYSEIGSDIGDNEHRDLEVN